LEVTVEVLHFDVLDLDGLGLKLGVDGATISGEHFRTVRVLLGGKRTTKRTTKRTSFIPLRILALIFALIAG